MKRFKQSKNDQFYFPSHTLFQLFLEIICHVGAELPPLLRMNNISSFAHTSSCWSIHLLTDRGLLRLRIIVSNVAVGTGLQMCFSPCCRFCLDSKMFKNSPKSASRAAWVLKENPKDSFFKLTKVKIATICVFMLFLLQCFPATWMHSFPLGKKIWYWCNIQGAML